MVQGEKTVQYTESANNGGKATSDKAAAAAAAAAVEGVEAAAVEGVVDSWELCVCGKQAGNKDTKGTHSYFLLGFIKER